MENPTVEKQERIRSFQIHSGILEGLRAYGIEGDKILPNFNDQIRGLSEKYAKLPHVADEAIQELWTQAAKRDLTKENELKREEVFQYVESRLGVKLTDSDRADLKELLWDIMDDEDLKRKERNEF